jgi:hypothetical protein
LAVDEAVLLVIMEHAAFRLEGDQALAKATLGYQHVKQVQQGRVMLEVPTSALQRSVPEAVAPQGAGMTPRLLLLEMGVQERSLLMVIITQVVVVVVVGQTTLQGMGESVVVVVVILIFPAKLVQVAVLLETVAAMVPPLQTTVLSLPEARVELIQEVGAVVRTNLVIRVLEEWAVTVAQV